MTWSWPATLAALGLVAAVGAQALPLFEVGLQMEGGDAGIWSSLTLGPIVRVHGSFLRAQHVDTPTADPASDGPPGEGAHIEVTLSSGADASTRWVGYGAIGESERVLASIDPGPGEDQARLFAIGLLCGGVLLFGGSSLVGLAVVLRRDPRRARILLAIGVPVFLVGLVLVGASAWLAAGDHLVGIGPGLGLAAGAVIIWTAGALSRDTDQARTWSSRRTRIALLTMTLLSAALALGPWVSVEGGVGPATYYGWETDGLILAGATVLVAPFLLLPPSAMRTVGAAAMTLPGLLILAAELGWFQRVSKLTGELAAGWGFWAVLVTYPTLLVLVLMMGRWGASAEPKDPGPRQFVPARPAQPTFVPLEKGTIDPAASASNAPARPPARR